MFLKKINSFNESESDLNVYFKDTITGFNTTGDLWGTPGTVPGRSLYPDTDEPVVMLTLKSWAPGREAITTIFYVFGVTRPGFEPTTSRTTSGCPTSELYDRLMVAVIISNNLNHLWI